VKLFARYRSLRACFSKGYKKLFINGLALQIIVYAEQEGCQGCFAFGSHPTDSLAFARSPLTAFLLLCIIYVTKQSQAKNQAIYFIHSFIQEKRYNG
jgi:hypothetical protein